MELNYDGLPGNFLGTGAPSGEVAAAIDGRWLILQDEDLDDLAELP